MNHSREKCQTERPQEKWDPTILAKATHKNFPMKKFNTKHQQRGQWCAAHSTIEDI